MSNRGAYGTKSPRVRPQTLGQRIRHVRILWGWSQGRFAEAIGTNQRLLSHWERDKAKPSGAALTSLSVLLGNTPEALLTGEGFAVSNPPALPEGVAKETVAQFSILSRLLPDVHGDGVTLVDIEAFEAKRLSRADASKAMSKLKGEVFLVVRKEKE